MLKNHAVIDGADATVRIDTEFQPHEMIVEDDLDSAAIQLTPAIARAIIAKLQGWLEVQP